jgi:hypothetical protein
MTNNPVVKIIAGLAICGLLLFTLAGAAVISAGTVYVSVEEKGADGFSISIPLPVNLASAALSFIPEEELEDIRAEIGPWMPVVEVVLEELARCPDGTLVEVEDDRETVSIVKRGGKLVIDVDNRHDRVHVSVPIRGVEKLVRQLGGRSSLI